MAIGASLLTGFQCTLTPRGGGVLGLEKGTDCGPSAAELWLSRANNAKKRGGGAVQSL